MLVRFWFRKSQTKRDAGIIFDGYVTVKGIRSKEFSNDLQTTKRNWIPKKQEFRGEDAIFNQELYVIRDKIFDIKRQLEKSKGILTADSVLRAYLSPVEQSPTILEVLQLFLEQRKRDVITKLIEQETQDTDEKYQKNLCKYLDNHRLTKLLCAEFSHKLADSFLEWLIIKQGYKRSYANRHITFLKMLLKYAKKNGYANEHPLGDYGQTHEKPAPPVNLKPHEIKLLQVTPLPVRFRRIADAYLFMCFSGLGLSDYTNLSSKQLNIDEDNFEWIEVYRDKTEVRAIIPVTVELRELIDKYGSIEALPRYSEGYFNPNLREAAARCGIEKYLTTHTGRKTFAKKLLREQSKPLNIAKMMGWTSTQQLKFYAEVDKDDLKEDLKR